jgi:predicted lipoprotein with Yx(FWY)xxD motif
MRRKRSVVVLVAGIAGLAAAVASLAVAKSFTLSVAKNAPVTNAIAAHPTIKHENIVVSSRGFAVYTLTGNNLKNCTAKGGAKSCFAFWPPVTVAPGSKLSAAPGVKGKLGTMKRSGFTQLTLNGHLLYNFSLDTKKDAANGDGIHSFGGIWHPVKASLSKASTTTTTTSTTTSTTTTSTTTTYPY